MAFRVGAEARQVDDRQIRAEAGEIGTGRPAQQVADEERVPGILREDAHADAVLRVGAAVQVLHEEIAFSRLGQEVGVQHRKLRLAQRLIVVPPDLVLGRGIADRELVLRRAAGV